MRMIAELMKHLEDLDGSELGDAAKPKPDMIAAEGGEDQGAEMGEPKGVDVTVAKVVPGSEKGPMEKLLAAKGGEGGDPKMAEPSDDDDMTDEELEEMAMMSK